jgi:hypothetical protein
VILVQSVFQTLAWTKLWHIGFLDFNRSAGTRVTASARGTLADGKSAKTHQGNRAAFFQCSVHCANGGFESATSRCLGQVSVFSNVFNQFCFIHKKPLGIGAGRTDVWTEIGNSSVDMFMKFVQASNA